MTTRHRSDVLIIGGNLAGLFTAALLSRRGLRCTVIGQDEIEGWQQLGDCLLPEWPFLLADFEADSATRAVVEDLGMRQELRRLLPFASPMLQFIDSDHRVDIDDDLELREVEFARGFGQAGTRLHSNLSSSGQRCDDVAGWLAQAPSFCDPGFWGARKYRQHLAKAEQLSTLPSVLDGIANDHPLRDFCTLLLPLTTHVSPSQAPALLHNRAATRLLLATRMARGGERASLADLAQKFCTQHGSEILPKAKIENLILRRNEVSAQLVNDSAARDAAFVVDASRDFSLAATIRKTRQSERYAHYREQVQHAETLVTWHMLLAPRALPQGIGQRIVVHSADGRGVLVSVDHLARGAKGDRSVAEGVAAVSATVVSPRGTAPEREHRYLRELLIELMPFCEPQIKAEAAGRERPLWRGTDDEQNAFGPSHCVTTTHGRLLRVGEDVLPAWGLEGELRGAWEAATLIRKKMKA